MAQMLEMATAAATTDDFMPTENRILLGGVKDPDVSLYDEQRTKRPEPSTQSRRPGRIVSGKFYTGGEGWDLVPTEKMSGNMSLVDMDEVRVCEVGDFYENLTGIWEENIGKHRLIDTHVIITGATVGEYIITDLSQVTTVNVRLVRSGKSEEFHYYGYRKEGNPVRWSYRAEARVQTYMAEFPGLSPLLTEAQESIAEMFGRGTRVTLEVMSFADEGAGDELVAWIQSTEDIETGLEKLDVLVDRWFDEIWEVTHGRFNFNIEFA